MTTTEARRLLRDLDCHARELVFEIGWSGAMNGHAERISTDAVRAADKLARTLVKDRGRRWRHRSAEGGRLMARYAEGTRVSVASSRGEITGILTKHGCDRMGWGTEPDGDTLVFVLGGHQFRFKITKPTLEDVRKQEQAAGKDFRYIADDAWPRKVEAEWMRRWRAHVLLIKAKLEFIEGGDTTLEREFLPYAVLKDGRTLGELVETGGLPLLAAGGS